MQVTLDIPDTYAAELSVAGKDPARVALKAFAPRRLPQQGASLRQSEQIFSNRTFNLTPELSS
jgi:hypothetical protein